MKDYPTEREPSDGSVYYNRNKLRINAMNTTTRSLISSSAMTGLLTGSAITFVGGADGKSGSAPFASIMNKHDCKGMNSCKGKGGCKSGDMGCKGRNSCKGKGGCKVP